MSNPSLPPAVPTLAFYWNQFAPYHADRCEAAAERLAARWRVVGLEMVASGDDYAWAPSSDGRAFDRLRLLPDASWRATTWRQRLAALVGALRRSGANPVFLCHYERPEVFLAACWLRLRGRRVFVMADSKFDDRPRRLWREALKALMYLPYNGALASGARTRDYLRFLGFKRRPIVLGYDAVSIDRVRRLAASPPAPDGAPFEARHFTIVARFVPKKNLALALAAYDLYRQAGPTPRDLVLIGDGPLRAELEAEVARRSLAGVRFAGFLQADGVAAALAASLALILPSIEEQWGLVVNEALALGVPVLCSDNVGARNDLVRVGVSGYVFEPDNAAGLARLMFRVASDAGEWRRLAMGARDLAPQGDVARFADAVATLIGDVGAPSA